MGCGTCCSRTALVVVNIISLLLGVGLLVAGCILKFGKSIVDQLLQNLLPKDADINLDLLFGDVAIALIVMGVVVFLISMFGCCGACCNSKCMLIAYVIVVGTILVVELICVILVVAMKSKLDSFLKSALNETIVNDYKGFQSFDTISLAWNLIQLELKCCGVTNYTDFHLAKDWSRVYTVDKAANISISMQLPITCCKLNATLDKISSIDPVTVLDCVKSPTIANANIEQGCYEAVEKVIGEQSGITIGVTCSILVCQLILVILACCVCNMNKDLDTDNKIRPV